MELMPTERRQPSNEQQTTGKPHDVLEGGKSYSQK